MKCLLHHRIKTKAIRTRFACRGEEAQVTHSGQTEVLDTILLRTWHLTTQNQLNLSPRAFLIYETGQVHTSLETIASSFPRMPAMLEAGDSPGIIHAVSVVSSITPSLIRAEH